MVSKLWDTQLSRAVNEDEVAAVCNRFLREWTAAEISEIPLACRPRDPIECEHIAPYALMLIGALGVGNRATDPMLYRMSAFFTKAALRLHEVMAVGRSMLPGRRSSSSGSSSAEG
jgi:hypothetical protein